MSWFSQLMTQTRYNLLIFRRNPAATFFTVIFPIIFLVIFTSLFGNETIDATGVRLANFYVPGILALALISATMVNLAITMTDRRESGVLKRVRGTPLRPWVFVLAQAVAAFVIAVFMTFLVVAIGRIAFDVSLQTSGIPGLLITLAIATPAFCALGLALTTIIPSVEAAPAITNAIVLPLYFVSDVFVVSDRSTPALMRWIGNLFPIKHLANALTEAFNPFIEGVPLPWGHWAVITAWGLFGLVVTLTRFRWSAR